MSYLTLVPYKSSVYSDAFFPSALDDCADLESTVCFASSEAGVAGRDVLEAANCHAGILGLGASVTPDAAAAGTLGASRAFAAILISDSPC